MNGKGPGNRNNNRGNMQPNGNTHRHFQQPNGTIPGQRYDDEYASMSSRMPQHPADSVNIPENTEHTPETPV